MDGPDSSQALANEPRDASPPTRSKAKITAELNFLTGQLTDRCRFLAVAVIGACWVLMSSPSVFVPTLLTVAILMAIFAVTADFLQYAAQYRHFSERYGAMLREDRDPIELNEKSFLYRSRWHFFHAKVIATAGSALLFCVAAALELLHRHS